ncbi:MAG: S9 family peptidase [Acidimicrobiales bacterium]
MAPPQPKRIPVTRTLHGDSRTDDYAWLGDSDDPDVVALLEAENAHTEDAMAHLSALRQQLFEEIRSRVKETDLSVPVRKGAWLYYSRTEEGLQYPIHCRRPVDAPEGEHEVVLADENELAGESSYLALGVLEVSPDATLLALSTDHAGDERYELRFVDLSGELAFEERIPGTYYGFAWSLDGRYGFYTTVDDANRPDRVWRHELATDPAGDVCIFHEPDERFFVGVDLTRSERFVLVQSSSMVTSEVHLLDAADPTGPLRVVAPRRQGVEYHVDDAGDRLVVLHNADGRVDFELAEAPADAPGPESWRPLVLHEPGVRLNDANAVEGYVLLELRRQGRTEIDVLPLRDGGRRPLRFEEEVRTVSLGDIAEFHTTEVRLHYQSLTTQPTVYDEDLVTGERILRKQQEIPVGHDPADYAAQRTWATAPDGTAVPVSVVARTGTPRDGTAPAVLYGYGAYEASTDPWFSVARLSLLDRGWVFAVAHVRGGGELGRRWYEDGKLLAKPNSFSDFVAAARHLVGEGWTSHDRLIARGGSAGGLLVGAALNLAPDAFRAVVAEVPFVDALTTICDPSLPLTVTEWEEWGNPLEDPDVYRCMRTYSPYDNVRAARYPWVFATAGLTDPRVGVQEPAKWVLRLRDLTNGDAPILLRTELGAGHRGPTGRYDAWRDEAQILAFCLWAAGDASNVG